MKVATGNPSSLIMTKTVHVIATQHLDVAWLWKRQPDGEELMRQCLARAVEMIENDPSGTHIHSRSTAWGFYIVQKRWPELFEKVRKYVASGHIEPCGGQWTEPDNLIPDGESMIRQSLLGQTYYKEVFGKTASVVWAPDVFGHGNTLPQLLKTTGSDGYYFHRCLPRDEQGRELRQFIWEGPDGTRIFCFAAGWTRGPTEELVAQCEQNMAETGLPMDFVATGRHSDRCIIMRKSWLTDMQRVIDHVEVNLRWASADDVLQSMKTYAERLPVLKGDLGGYIFTGTYTSDQITKRYNRQLENDLCEVEALAVVAARNGKTYPAEMLTNLWRDLCVNQFHDIICGTCYADVQAEAHELYRDMQGRTDVLRNQALDTLGGVAKSDAQPGTPVLVWNGLSFARKDPISIPLPQPGSYRVRDREGNSLPVQLVAGDDAVVCLPIAPVPALAGEVYYLEKVGPVLAVFPEQNFVLENAYLRCEIDSDNGRLLSLYDKVGAREYLRPGGEGNRFVYYEDRTDLPGPGYRQHNEPPHTWDPWAIGYTGKHYNPVGSYQVEVVEDGPVRKVIRTRRKISLYASLPDTEIMQEIALYTDSPILHFHTWGNWQAKFCLLKAEFDLAYDFDSVVCDVPYGIIERDAVYEAGFQLNGNSAAEDRVSADTVCEEPDRAMQKWIDVADEKGGLLFLNNGKYGYGSSRGSIGLSLMRAPQIRIGDFAGLGPFEFSYALMPHVGDWKSARAVAQGYAFNRPLSTRIITRHDGAVLNSLFTVDASNIFVTAIKRAEGGERVVLRLYESSGEATVCTLTSSQPFATAYEGNAIEEPLSLEAIKEVGDGALQLSFRPFEVKTILLGV